MTRIREQDHTFDDYRTSHEGEGSLAAGYDEGLFGGDTYDSRLWEWERSLLDQLLSRHVVDRERYLDFACGTGRVLAHLEGSFVESIGLDVSQSMLSQAEKRGVRAQLIQGDATVDPAILQGTFDCVTAFRFFLNAQDELRNQAMALLASRLGSNSSRLIFNVHGNRFSTRAIPAFFHQFGSAPYNTMSLGDVRRLTQRHGLEIVEWRGLSYLDKAFFNLLPRFIWLGAEAALKPISLLRRYSVYLYFVCRRV